MAFRGDSISAFRGGRDIYNGGFSRQELKQRQEKLAIEDTLEPPKVRYDRQQPIKAGAKGGDLSGDRVVVIARAGRYLIMALVIPPYFLLYGAPKWLLTSLVPRLWGQLDFRLADFNKFVQKAAQWVSERLNSTFRTVAGAINWMVTALDANSLGLRRQLRSSFEVSRRFLRRKSQEFGDRRRRSAAYVADRLRAAGKRVERAFGDFWGYLTSPFIRWIEAIKKAVNRWLENVKRRFASYGEAVRRQISLLKKRAAAPFIALGSAYKRFFEKVSHSIARNNRSFAARLRSLTDRVERGIRWPFIQLGKGRREVKRLLWELHLFIQRGIVSLPKKMDLIEEKVSHYRKKNRARMDKFIKTFPPFIYLNALWGRIQRAKLALSRRIRDLFSSVQILIKARVNAAARPIAALFLKGKKRLSLFSVRVSGEFKSLQTRLSRRVASMGKVLSLLYTYTKEMVEELSDDLAGR